MESVKSFKENGYCIVKNVLGQETLDIITQYALFDEMQNFNSEKSQGRFQVPDAHSVYADPAMESILLYLQPILEKNTGLKLHPTYSYYRVYRSGDELANHTDRESCEISSTVCFNYDYNNRNFSWPIFMDGNRIDQEPGDMVIYRGCDLPHWREELNIYDDEIWHVQGFFHYVDANGPCAEYRFDKRESIGSLKMKKSVAQLNKSYIEYTK